MVISDILMCYGGGGKEMFWCRPILKDLWRNLGDHFGPSKQLRKHCVCLYLPLILKFQPVFPLQKFYIEQMLLYCALSACNCATMQTHNQWSGPSGKPTFGPPCIGSIEFGMLQVRENEISLRKWSGGSADLRTLEGKWQSCFLKYISKRSSFQTVVKFRKYGKVKRFSKKIFFCHLIFKCDNQTECLQQIFWKFD